MTSELANIGNSGALQIRTVDDLGWISDMLAKSGYFPDAKTAAQCGVKVLAGIENGIGTFAAMNGIHIIKGRTSMGANLMAAAVKRSPKYNYRVREHSDKVCEIEFFEKGESIGVAQFTEADAKKAQTQNMQKFPKSMLFARCMSNGVRWYCPDVFDCPVYTPEELGADVDEQGNVMEAEVMPIKSASTEVGDLVKALVTQCDQEDIPVREIAKDNRLNPPSNNYSLEEYKLLSNLVDQYEAAMPEAPLDQVA